jgi:NAD(P)-dependent dehydrogenase (short-subunit alcohol dehydrogenase family)
MMPPADAGALSPAVPPAPLVLVTGASQGIGAAIALRFARGLSGCRLALVARNAAKLQATAEACSASAQAEAFAADLSVPEQVSLMANDVQARWGTPDVLINVAGWWRGGPAHELSVEDFAAVLNANLLSSYAVTRAFLPAMIARKSGDIFNMSSTAGLQGFPGNVAYCAAKFGVTGMTKALRLELREHGIRVCCVHPGPTLSPSWDGTGVAAERLMPAEDVAQAFFDIYRLSRNTVVEEIVLRPQLGDI